MPSYIVRHTAAIAIGAATPKSALSIITGATRRARIKRVTLGFLSVTAADVPGTCEIVQHDTDGTGTATTPQPLDPAETASITTAKHTYTAEPTVNITVRDHFSISPQGVTIEKAYGPGEELVCPISKTTTFRITMPQAQSVWIAVEFEE